MPAPGKVRSLPSLPALVRSFEKRKIVVVGDLVADHYIYGQTDRVSREAPVLIVRHESSEVKLGGAANVAANARAMGAQVTLLGIVGADEMGRAIAMECAAQRIRLLAPSHKGLATETKTRILAGGLNTTRQQMLRLDRGQRGPLPQRVQRELAAQLRELAASADAVIVSDYGAGVIAAEVRAALRELASDDVPVCVDSRYALRELPGMTVAKPNEPELQALTGMPLSTPAELAASGARALELLSARALLVTRGRNGMALFRPGQAPLLLPVHGPAEAVDVTGAGDTVISSFSLAVAAGASLEDAARISNVAGGLVVQKQGTATVAKDELLAGLPR